jgi:hypothetical protein
MEIDPGPLQSVFVLIFIFVVTFFDDVQFNWIEADYLQLNSALFAFHDFTFVRIGIDMDIGLAFWARSGRHLLYLQR